jgi:hypothetical protein
MAITLYRLHRERDRWVKWEGPDGVTHQLDALNHPPLGQWAFVYDADNRPVMAWRQPFIIQTMAPPTFLDAELVVSLDGAPSLAATLLHDDDDWPKKYYFATDGGNGNPLGRWAFKLLVEGVSDMPVATWVNLRVMVVS